MHGTDDRDVTTVCRCGCGEALPAAPAGGGRAPLYASPACRQRAHRRRRPVAPTTPADPPSVAPLLAQVRELAAVLDAGGRPDPTGVRVVEDLTGRLLARARSRGQTRWLPWVDAAGRERTALDDGDVEALTARLYADGARTVGPPQPSRPACARWVQAWRRDTSPGAQTYAPLELVPGYPLTEVDARVLVQGCRDGGESWASIAARAGVPVAEARTRWG
uniref:hypothetical protein n=1 Tax=Frankia torreyi TaxID=1856 RepID=UPI0037C50617